jgi:D-methionine transport system substrate-binding protein
VVAAVIAGLGLAGCSDGADRDAPEGFEKPLRLYVTPVPQGDIARYVQELADKDGSGLKLEIIEADGTLEPNQAISLGDVDASLYQHVPFFDRYIAEHPDVTNLVNGATVLVNVFALYSDRYDDPKDLPDGAEILVPNEQTNLPRALFVLQDAGLITLSYPVSDGSPEALAIDIDSIVSNPRHLKLTPTETNLRAEALPDADAAFINGDVALSHSIDPSKAIATERTQDNPYANVLTTTTDKIDDPRIRQLIEYLTGDDVAAFIEDTYQGYVLPAQKVLPVPEGTPRS